MRDSTKTISFQGEMGANSHLSCRAVYPDMEALACPTFEDAFLAVEEGKAALAMIPIENSVAGRVADIHQLMPESGLSIIGEHFQPVKHQLMVKPGTTLDKIKSVHSHVQALGQCRQTLRDLGLTTRVEADTAGSAKLVAEEDDPSQAAIASTLAAEIYGLEILCADIEDSSHNTTRFVILSRDPVQPDPGSGSAC